MNDGNPRENLAQCPLPLSRYSRVQLAHGSGGRMMNELIRKLFLEAFDDPTLNKMEDCATLVVEGKRLTFSTDSYVVDPIFFPGGNIGELAVNGTVNDLSMAGARPLYLSVGFILEEGFSMQELHTIVDSMQAAARRAGVAIVTGDTKVVDKGKADKIFINTSGVGVIEHEFVISPERIETGDCVLLSGTIGDHGIAVFSQREGLSFESPIESDTAALNGLVGAIVEAGGDRVRALRDPTRGGLAATLNEFAEQVGVTIEIDENRIPLQPAVMGACELLGLDPLYVANEGKLTAVVAPEIADVVLKRMREHPLGRNAALIGKVASNRRALVSMRTRIGGVRIVDLPVGEQLPRIC